MNTTLHVRKFGWINFIGFAKGYFLTPDADFDMQTRVYNNKETLSYSRNVMETKRSIQRSLAWLGNIVTMESISGKSLTIAPKLYLWVAWELSHITSF